MEPLMMIRPPIQRTRTIEIHASTHIGELGGSGVYGELGNLFKALFLLDRAM